MYKWRHHVICRLYMGFRDKRPLICGLFIGTTKYSITHGSYSMVPGLECEEIASGWDASAATCCNESWVDGFTKWARNGIAWVLCRVACWKKDGNRTILIQWWMHLYGDKYFDWMYGKSVKPANMKEFLSYAVYFSDDVTENAERSHYCWIIPAMLNPVWFFVVLRIQNALGPCNLCKIGARNK